MFPPSVFINNKRHLPVLWSSDIAYHPSRPCSWSLAGLNQMEERTICFIWLSPSPPPPPPVSVSLSYHWLAAGLTTRFGQCVVSTGCLSPPREPSKPMNRTQWMKAWGYWWLPPNLTQVLCGLHSGASFSGLCLVYRVGLIALNLWHIAHYSF